MLVADLASSGSQPSLIPPLVWTAVLSAAGVVIGLFLFFQGFVLLRRKRLVQDIPVSTTRGAAMGSVEIRGKAVGPYTLLSPISALECYFYRVEVWQAVEEERSRRWKKRVSEMLLTPLFIEDETGRLLVDPRDAELLFSPDTDEQCDSGISELMGYSLERHGISPGDLVRITEYSIKPGDEIFVLATLCQNEKPLGFLSAQAADLQRRGVLDGLHVAVEKPGTPFLHGFDTSSPVVLAKGDGDSPFVVSRQSPKEVVQDLASKAAVYIWGGALLAFACFGILLAALAR